MSHRVRASTPAKQGRQEAPGPHVGGVTFAIIERLHKGGFPADGERAFRALSPGRIDWPNLSFHRMFIYSIMARMTIRYIN